MNLEKCMPGWLKRIGLTSALLLFVTGIVTGKHMNLYCSFVLDFERICVG